MIQLHKEKLSKLNVMEQSPKMKFQKDGAVLHFLPKSLINLEKQINIFLARYKFFNSRVQKKSRLHGCEPEEGLLNLCQF